MTFSAIFALKRRKSLGMSGERIFQPMSMVIEAVMGSAITSGFSLLIIGVFAIAAFGRSGRLAVAAPAILTSLGVLGTFVGIFVGLMDFDVRNIDASVPHLLEGMKTAFFTSIVGMACAILLKAGQSIFTGAEETSGAGPDDIYAILREIRDVNGRTVTATESLQTAISGGGDSSVVTQLQLLRSDTRDKQDGLQKAVEAGFKQQIDEFREFARTMAENNSKALVDALREVIADFNAKINEQFGENFKHLNEAVGKLLEWQENYRRHVEDMTDRLEKALSAVEATEKSLALIVAEAERVPPTVAALSRLLTGLEAQTAELERHLEAFADLRKAAGEAFPVVEQNLRRLTADVGDEVSRTVATMEQAFAAQQQRHAELSEAVATAAAASAQKIEASLTEQNRTAASIAEGFRLLEQETAALVAKASETLQTSMASAGEEMARAVKDQSESMRKMLGDIDGRFDGLLKESSKRLVDNFEHFDAGMQKELDRVIGQMGSHLASLSSKFVEDYAPLTDRLRRLVDAAKVA